MTPIPSFIYKKKNQIMMVLFVPLFALAFILIYQPLDFNQLDEKVLPWLNLSPNLKNHILSFCIVLIGMAVAAISRAIMTAYTKRRAISYQTYIIWVACEIVIMTLIYTIVSVITSDVEDPTSIFYNTLIKTILILPQSFPASGAFPMSWLFTSGGQSIGASASTSLFTINI